MCHCNIIETFKHIDMKITQLIFTLCLLVVGILQANNPHQKNIIATRITQAPTIDGDMKDACWANLPVANQFITNEPNYGQPPHVPCEVRIGYDDDAIYVFAKMSEKDPSEIAKELSERDNIARADLFAISFDTYDDDQNALRFMVTAADNQIDGKYNPSTDDNGNNITWDWKWDAIWTSKARIVEDGWLVEMRIPYQALRFAKKPLQNWGIQFQNYCQRHSEEATWAPLDPKLNGTITQYGEFSGLQNLQPPLRLSFSPYLAYNIKAEPKDANKSVLLRSPKAYNYGRGFNGGMDLKYGINESFTLDMTLVPDFGQVQSDNLVRNLSAFEVKFEERRPFFTEGTELFSKGNLFYSRRIGGRPQGLYRVGNQLLNDEKMLSNPSEIQLYNATKVSGRTKGKLGIGILNAVSAPAFATAENTKDGSTRRIQTDVLTNYNVFVLDQPLKNNSNIYLANTNVMRKGKSDYGRDANVTAVGFRFQDKKGKYEASGKARLSQIFENNNARNNGYTYDVSLGKVSGNHTYSFSHEIQSDKYDPSDLGIFTGNNYISNSVNYSYAMFQPKGRLLNFETWTGVSHSLRYKPTVFQDFNFNTGYWCRFKNFWGTNMWVNVNPVRTFDYFEPRIEGLKFRQEANANLGFNVNTDSRKKFTFGGGPRFGISKFEKNYRIGFYAWPSYQLSDKLNMGYLGGFTNSRNNVGFATYNADFTAPVFGRRNLWNVENQINANYKFSTKMNITLRFRHYWNKINYSEFFDLDKNGGLVSNDFKRKIDENLNTFNMDMIYTWQFAPGSFFNFTWKSNGFVQDEIGEGSYLNNLNRTIKGGKNQIIALKVIYFVDYDKLRKLGTRNK